MKVRSLVVVFVLVLVFSIASVSSWAYMNNLPSMSVKDALGYAEQVNGGSVGEGITVASERVEQIYYRWCCWGFAILTGLFVLITLLILLIRRGKARKPVFSRAVLLLLLVALACAVMSALSYRGIAKMDQRIAERKAREAAEAYKKYLSLEAPIRMKAVSRPRWNCHNRSDRS